MKNNFKNLLWYFILAFAFTICLNSCQDDEPQENHENSDELQDIISRKFSLEQIPHFNQVSEKLNTLNSNLNNENGFQSRTVDTNNVSILTDDVLFMEYAETHTYTFKLLRDNPLHFIENIVLHYNVDSQDYDEYLIQYNISFEQYQDVVNGLPLDETAEVDIFELDNGTLISLLGRTSCFRTCQTISVNCTAGGNHPPNDPECCANDGSGDCSPDQGGYYYQSCGAFCLDNDPTIVTEEPDPNQGGGGGNPNGIIVTNPNAIPCDNSSTGDVGDVGGDGCITTAEDIARNTLFDRLATYLTSQEQADWIALQANVEVVNIFNDFLDEPNFTNQSVYNEFASNLISVIMSDFLTDVDALQFTLEAFRQDKIYNDIDGAFLSSVNEFLNLNTLDSEMHDPITIHFIVKMAVIRATQPDICDGLSEWQCDLKVFWEATKDVVHIFLDGVGLIPVVGEVADLINGGLYLLEGDGVNATLSFAATIPFAGWAATGSKYAIKIIDATTIGTKIKLSWKVLENGAIYFGSSGSKLRKVLGITDSALQAHHLMPWALRNNDVIQKAAKSGSAFHMNEALNGIAVASWRNQPNHNTYNNLIESKLNTFNNLNPNASVDDAYNFVSDLIADVRDWVINNPNSHLNDLVLP